jgi:hypothetical protein
MPVCKGKLKRNDAVHKQCLVPAWWHPVARESGGEPRAVQTLRVGRAFVVFAKRLDCACFSTALISSQCHFISKS